MRGAKKPVFTRVSKKFCCPLPPFLLSVTPPFAVFHPPFFCFLRMERNTPLAQNRVLYSGLLSVFRVLGVPLNPHTGVKRPSMHCLPLRKRAGSLSSSRPLRYSVFFFLEVLRFFVCSACSFRSAFLSSLAVWSGYSFQSVFTKRVIKVS